MPDLPCPGHPKLSCGPDPVGLPTGAGYAAGVRLVGEYLRLQGGTAASNVHALAETILSDVLPRLGLGNE